ncbi:MAG: universal stress protein [Microcystaceae cyanobacterium]
MGYQKILVALDRSSHSQTLFDHALDIAKKDGASLMLFHCLPIESRGTTAYAPFYGEELLHFSQAIREMLEKETEVVRQWLADYCQTATDQGIATEWDWKIGEAGYWIGELAHTWNADLVVIGRRGRRGLAEIFLGSVSNYVVHHVSCSVLVVQGSDEIQTSA